MGRGKTSDGAGDSGETDGVSGGGPSGGGQKGQKLSQVFLRNLPLSMLEPVRPSANMLSIKGAVQHITMPHSRGCRYVERTYYLCFDVQ